MRSHNVLWASLFLFSLLFLSGCNTANKLPSAQSGMGLIDSSLITSQTKVALQAVSATASGLKVVATETGKLAFSADGAGSNNLSGTSIQINKPNASVSLRKALLACASYAGRVINDGDVSLDGSPVVWSQNVANPIGTMPWFDSVLSDVTALVKAKTDAAPTGAINFSQTEVTTTIDGCALYAVFDDPTQTTDSTVILLFGGQRTSGDSFSVSLGQPVDKTTPNQVLELSLATSYGYQGVLSTQQYSQIDVNGTRISSASGGQDDCDVFSLPSNECGMNGALMTVGGSGDTNTNQANPLATATTNAHSDDELYNLLPFVNNGDTTVTVSTRNPSNDDNIFAAAVVTSYNATGIPNNPNVNVAPTVSANTSSVVVNKGDLAANSGVYADADGDPVTLTASVGTLVQGTGTWNWSFDTTGSSRNQIVTITATDDKGNKASTNFALTVLEPNQPPSVSIDINPVVVDEGKKASSTLTLSDPDGDSVSLTASIGRVSDDSLTGIWNWSFDTVDGPAESQTVTLTATDSRGASSTITFPLMVNNTLPILTGSGVLVSATTLGVNSPLSASASFKDGGVLDTHTARWNWGDGSSAATVVESAGSGSVADSHSYTAPGTYTVTLILTDKDGGSVQESSRAITVSSTLSAKGKGRIASPAGAYSATPALTGNADFEFSSAYTKGVLGGKVLLKLSAVRFDFSGVTQESLAVDGTSARIRGTGTVNGAGKFGFLVVATDGGAAPNTDSFRIKIWDINNGNAVVYDNQKGQPDTSNVGSSVSGDSITVVK